MILPLPLDSAIRSSLRADVAPGRRLGRPQSSHLRAHACNYYFSFAYKHRVATAVAVVMRDKGEDSRAAVAPSRPPGRARAATIASATTPAMVAPRALARS